MQQNHLQSIINELNTYSIQVQLTDIQAVAKACLAAKRIFVGGAGRSGFAARGFSNRLMHLGLTAFFVGEPTTPSIYASDLLVLGSGSGTTASLVFNANKAKSVGASLATLTIFPEATIGKMADTIIEIPGASPKKAEGAMDSAASTQPMGNLFEQLSWLVYDSIIMELMVLLGETSETMFPRHANLE